MNIIDLSHDIAVGMPVFPGDPQVLILNHQNYQDGYLIHNVFIGTHCGTHVDAPLHKNPKTNAIDEISIEKFIVKAYVMDVTFLTPKQELTEKHLEKIKSKIKGINAIIFKSNWSLQYESENYFSDFPGISEGAAKWIIKNKISLIGLETPSVSVEKHKEIHEALLSKDITIVEGLANVDKITKEYVEFYAVPLKIKGLDGSPVRAFAIED